MKHLRKLLLLSKTLNKKKLKILGLNTLTLLLNKPRDNKNFKKRWLMIPWNQNINLMLLNVPIKICIIFPINSMLWTECVISGKITIENLINYLNLLVKPVMKVIVVIVVTNISEAFSKANFSNVKINVSKLFPKLMLSLLIQLLNPEILLPWDQLLKKKLRKIFK